ncbi:MAG: hypothetical protein NTZ27_02875 [Ignavibacteriales bacterium]|nr:hypothetical protein [Ignavibacteriales bacterium]
MKTLKLISLLLILGYFKLCAQFSIETFLDEPLNKTFSEVKELLADKKYGENLDGTFNIITYYEWLEPISIRINFMFKKDGKPVSKGIFNAKETEEDAQKLFNILNGVLIKKYGQSISQKSLFGITAYSWSGVGGSVVTFAQASKKTRLMIMTFK